MSTKPFAYVCTAGHVDRVPSLGTYQGCQHMVAMRLGRGFVPCNAPVVVLPDPSGELEATFLVGGAPAVNQVLIARAGAPDEPVRVSEGTPRG